jgi:hypothetical protein
MKTTGCAVISAAMMMGGGAFRASANTILGYTVVIGLHGGNVTATITLEGTVAPNTIYTTDDFISATITDTTRIGTGPERRVRVRISRQTQLGRSLLKHPQQERYRVATG